MNFSKFQAAVSHQFQKMSKHRLFCTDVEKDEMWTTYLASFPAGSNPIFRERTEHDCNCCKSFIRKAGNMVAIIDGKLVSLWDVKVDEPAYQAVADAMSALVHEKAINRPFLHYERTVGVQKNYDDKNPNLVQAWHHFFLELEVTGSNVYVLKKDIDTKIGEMRADHDVFLRSLKEISRDALDTVLDLIESNNLYRGQEQKTVVATFRKMQIEFDKLRYSWEQDLFAWSKIHNVMASILRIRNTSIGTLLTAISENPDDVEGAVKSYEDKVAPENYKRPTSLVTKAMVEKAKAKIEELGLTSALERRYAYLPDISVRDILFVDRGTRKQLKNDIWASIATNKAFVNLDEQKLETVPIEEFLQNIVPQIASLEVMVDNSHHGNFVSLIAPVDPNARLLFKWNNNFSWCYNGDVTDSIKERVKKAGGNVTGELCCRLSWHNFDDLDLHMKEPHGEIYFRAKRSPITNGQLDVDMNAGEGTTREPVENIFYPLLSKMVDGKYTLYVNQFLKRETERLGFEVEVEFSGNVYSFSYEKPMRNNENVVVAEFDYSKKSGLAIRPILTSKKLPVSMWNIRTMDFHKVNVMMLSPNYWDGEGVGSKHYFFMLEDCLNDGKARGIFNEFIKSELDPHRKVIEIVGSKLKTDESSSQLSGLGFSSTKRNALLCRVKGNVNRVIKITF